MERQETKNTTTDMNFFTEEQIMECRELFDMFDKDADGELDREAFGPMMRTLGLKLSEAELDKFFHEMDESGDGSLEFDELLTFLERIAKPVTVEEELREAFRLFDPSSFTGEEEEEEVWNPKGKVITKTSLTKIMKDMGEVVNEGECLDMIAAATNGLDTIDFPAFKRFARPPKKNPAPRASPARSSA
eukprot:TRINITY_DN98343_c0_g1_i1.p2 TRINITY_DN98343_c0_g1~~TRINITY_DN98343_c0_g1_i1.p2  ORF type:complete len:189 (+),score=65.03 TRINITY_DN98343_c0_g1_i1:89-655(+)